MNWIIDHLKHKLSEHVIHREWRRRESKKRFPYKCYPLTKSAAKRKQAYFKAGIKETQKHINELRLAIRTLEYQNELIKLK